MAPYHILKVIISSLIPENLVLLTKSEQSGPKSAHIRSTICTKLSKCWPNTSYFSSVVSSTTISDHLRFSHVQFLNGTHYHQLCAVQPPTQSFDGLSHLKISLDIDASHYHSADHSPVSYISRMGDWYGYQLRFRFR